MKPVNVTNLTLQFDTNREDLTIEDVNFYIKMFNDVLSSKFEVTQPQIILNKNSVAQVIELIDE